jgi:hypothetical protein
MSDLNSFCIIMIDKLMESQMQFFNDDFLGGVQVFCISTDDTELSGNLFLLRALIKFQWLTVVR